MAAGPDPATAMLFQQFLASLMASQPGSYPMAYGGSAVYDYPASDPLRYSAASHTAYSKNAEALKRSRAETMAKHLLSLYASELTLREALSPIPAKLPQLALHALTPRQATQHDEQKTLFLAHRTREFRGELEKFDNDIPGRKEALVKFGDFVCTALFGLDWDQTTRLRYSGKATPSSIYSDHEVYDDGYYYDPPPSGNLCAKHAAEASKAATLANSATAKSEPQQTARDDAKESSTGATQKKSDQDMLREIRLWNAQRRQEQGLDRYEYDFDDYGFADDYDFDYVGASDPEDPYEVMDRYNRAFAYDADDPESYFPYDEDLYDDYEEYLDFVMGMRRDELLYAMQSSDVYPGMGFKKKKKKQKRRGSKKGKAAKPVAASKGGDDKQGNNGSSADVKNDKGKEKLEKTSEGAAPSQITTVGGNTAASAATPAPAALAKSKSQLSTPQKPSSPFQMFRNPLHAGSPLGTHSSPSMLTTASVGLNLARPAASIGGFRYQSPKPVPASSKGGFSFKFPDSTAADAKRTLPTNKGPTAEELRREFQRSSDAVLAKMKANAQKQQEGSKKGIAGSSMSGGVDTTKGKHGLTGKPATAAFGVAGGATKARPASPPPAPGEWKVIYQYQPPQPQSQPKPKPAAAPKRKKEPSSSSSEATPLPTTRASTTSKPAKKKLNPAFSSTQTTPSVAISGILSVNKTSKQSTANANKSSSANSKAAKPKPGAAAAVAPAAQSTQPQAHTHAQKPKGIKYQMVVYKKPYMPSMRPQRDCWHGRVWL
ncbi:uncharacterized protein SRS1_13530 [Sporisorium reilianum f. sp. reilianum]|uniref:Uncharacterized protein n=1 Tax=Sporisorium reilianum f. sp. reilianum TaxID=72559 RepID=A0A2N8UMP5_9BASI|nr:uncharacterized protein SRS1_13530 [Sporisorium reilianum f. sp. reilianum]